MANKTTRKCNYCKTDGEKDQMTVIQTGVKTKVNRFFHESCFGKYEEEQAFKEAERIELEELRNVIMDIYDVKTLPHQVYPYLQDLRNGTEFFGRNTYKYKQGYSYKMIAETYRYCSETIDYYNRNKDFKGGFLQAFKYGLAIVSDKLFIVQKKYEAQAKRDKMAEKKRETIELSDELYETSYKKKKKESYDFLDD